MPQNTVLGLSTHIRPFRRPSLGSTKNKPRFNPEGILSNSDWAYGQDYDDANDSSYEYEADEDLQYDCDISDSEIDDLLAERMTRQ